MSRLSSCLSRRASSLSKRSQSSAQWSVKSWRRSETAGRILRALPRPKPVSSLRPTRPTWSCKAMKAWTRDWISWRINCLMLIRVRTSLVSTISWRNYKCVGLNLTFVFTSMHSIIWQLFYIWLTHSHIFIKFHLFKDIINILVNGFPTHVTISFADAGGTFVIMYFCLFSIPIYCSQHPSNAMMTSHKYMRNTSCLERTACFAFCSVCNKFEQS